MCFNFGFTDPLRIHLCTVLHVAAVILCKVLSRDRQTETRWKEETRPGMILAELSPQNEMNKLVLQSAFSTKQCSVHTRPTVRGWTVIGLHNIVFLYLWAYHDL